MNALRRGAGIAALALLAAGEARARRPPEFSRDSVGTTGSEFLTLDVGARGIAMGGAISALTDDAHSLYWNPAGLARVPRLSAAFMYSHYVADISYQAGSVARRFTDYGVLGAGWRYMDIGELDHVNVSGIKRGTFHPRHYVGELGWGQSVYDQSDSEMDLTVGGTLRWIHSDLLAHADGFGGDLGMQSRFYQGSAIYDFGAVLQNMGRGQNFDKERDTLPFRMKIGAAVYPLKSLALTVEGVFPINNYPHAAFGAEYGLNLQKGIRVALRAGFNSSTIESLGPLSTMNMGMGLKLSDLSFDYAFTPLGVLGSNNVHRMTFSWNLPSKSSKRYRER